MVDIDTFLTTLYVIVDEYCKSELATEAPRHGPQASLSCSEVVTLAVFGQWSQFESERGFYRYAERHPVWRGSDLMISRDFRLASQPKLAYIPFVFGSTSTWGVIPWLLLTCLSGKYTMITHTKRSNVAFMLFPLLSFLLSILLSPGSSSMADPVAVVLPYDTWSKAML